jgi:hypothetical protein
MGRPIKKSFFGNLNTGSASTGADDGIGGEGVASVALGTAGSAYSQGVTLTASAPQLPNGVTALFSVTVTTATGAVASYNVVEAGSGYTAAPTVSFAVPATVTKAGTTGTTATTVIYTTNTTGIYAGMVIAGGATGSGGRVVSIGALNGAGVYPIYSTVANNLTFTAASITFTDQGTSAVPGAVTMASTQDDAITIVSYLPTASQSRTGGDIIKQESSRRYLVRNSDGYGQCTLTTGTLTAGFMHIIAADFYGGTYYVTKLTAHRAVLQVRSNTSSCIYSSGDVAPWNITAATGTYVTLNHTI